MRVALLIPGSGSRFYCENCARDSGLVNGLIRLGHEVITCPMYLPLGIDHPEPLAHSPIFYGAVSVYLKQMFPLLRKTPHWVDRVLDSKPMLAMAGALSGSTNAAGLEALTISMLNGEHGNQSGELDRLISWLKLQRPDILHLSNGLLLGVARKVKRELHIPVICSLQDEDVWIDAMEEPYGTEAWRILAKRAADADLLLPVSEYYRESMAAKLSIPRNRMRVVPVGIPVHDIKKNGLSFSPPVIGFLSHISKAMGLKLLIEAFIKLHENPRHRSLRLNITGGSTSADRAFIRECMRKLDAKQLGFHVHIQQAFDRADRVEFLMGITLLSVPVLGGEAFGSFQLEAMAAGVPVVQPALGGFPEIIEKTGGGILYSPNTAEALAQSIDSILTDREKTRRLGAAGRDAVLRYYTIDRMAELIDSAYSSKALSHYLRFNTF